MHTYNHERSGSKSIGEMSRRGEERANLKKIDSLLSKAGRFLIIPMGVAFLNLMLIVLFKS